MRSTRSFTENIVLENGARIVVDCNEDGLPLRVVYSRSTTSAPVELYPGEWEQVGLIVGGMRKAASDNRICCVEHGYVAPNNSGACPRCAFLNTDETAHRKPHNNCAVDIPVLNTED